MKKQLSGLYIIFIGELIVNIPVTFLILLTAFLLIRLGISYNISIILGASLGWLLWSKLIDVWRDWGIKKGITEERLFKLGKLGLINFYKYKIFKLK